MKALKIITITVLVLVVIFFSIGILIPVFEYGNSVTINAPKDKVWSLYTDHKEDWIDGFKSQKLTNGTALTKEAEYETIIISGEEMVMHEKIESIDAGRKIEWTLDNDVLVSRYSYEFAGDSTKTEVTTHYSIEGKNAFMKTILYLSKGHIESSDNDMLTALKKIAEK